MVRASVAAGSCLLFEGRTWHTSLLNTSGRDRLAAVFTFAPFWHKQSPELVRESVALSLRQEASAPELALTALHKQLLGIELVTQQPPLAREVRN